MARRLDLIMMLWCSIWLTGRVVYCICTYVATTLAQKCLEKIILSLYVYVCCSLVIEILTKIGCLEYSTEWGWQFGFSTPSEGNSSGPISALFHQRFVEFTTRPGVDVGPTLFTIVLKNTNKYKWSYKVCNKTPWSKWKCLLGLVNPKNSQSQFLPTAVF